MATCRCSCVRSAALHEGPKQVDFGAEYAHPRELVVSTHGSVDCSASDGGCHFDWRLGGGAVATNPTARRRRRSLERDHSPDDGVAELRTGNLCDKAIDGYRVFGESKVPESELWKWFDAKFGETHEEPTARLNGFAELIGAFAVYDDIQVWISGSSLWVRTYDTVSHDCLIRDVDQWDLRNASSIGGICVETNLRFWGVDYGKVEAANPPEHWAIIDFEEGRRIAHGLDDLEVVYAQESEPDGWHRYIRGTECGLD